MTGSKRGRHRILHTSDWHIGRMLYGRKRYEEFDALLNWMSDTIRLMEIDTLLVSGDIFDIGAPSNRAQELYYRFLCRTAASSCRHVVAIAGNHDSPSFLNAPKELLRALDVHVVGSSAASPEDEVLVLRNEQDAPELIVCAVPYLRDRDIRTAEAGESIEDKEGKLIDGIRNHYAAVAEAAERRRNEMGPDLPVVAMGHLFTTGGKTVEGDGVRELYVGSLAHVTPGIFSSCFDYVALGHLHSPQTIGAGENIRYSGSPLPMGFGEAKQRKSVCIVDFDGRTASVRQTYVPVFQELERVKGDMDDIARRIRELSAAGSQAWLEIVYEGGKAPSDLRQRIESEAGGSLMEILRMKNNHMIDTVFGRLREDESLDDLDVNDVFTRCLDLHRIPEDRRAELLDAYRETLLSLEDEDALAEQGGRR